MKTYTITINLDTEPEIPVFENPKIIENGTVVFLNVSTSEELLKVVSLDIEFGDGATFHRARILNPTADELGIESPMREVTHLFKNNNLSMMDITIKITATFADFSTKTAARKLRLLPYEISERLVGAAPIASQENHIGKKITLLETKEGEVIPIIL